MEKTYRQLLSDGEFSEDVFTFKELTFLPDSRIIFEDEKTIVISDLSGIQAIFYVEQD